MGSKLFRHVRSPRSKNLQATARSRDEPFLTGNEFTRWDGQRSLMAKSLRRGFFAREYQFKMRVGTR